MRRSLPVLNNAPDALDLVEIPIPCEVPWDSMPGDEQVRHCGQCKQNVYNVSSLTRAEAMQLMRSRACLRIYRRPDNTVITSDCRARLRAARKRGLWVFAGALLVVLWAQICAQLVGLMGLRRLIGGGATMGEPAPMPGQVVDVPLMGAPPPLPPPALPVIPESVPIMGEIAPPPAPPKPPKPRLMGKPSAPPSDRVMGRIAFKREPLTE
jgi:hypothetical protein